MGNAAFVLVALGVSLVGSILLWLRNRKPTSFMSSIDDFQREMQALAREQESGGRRRRGSRAMPDDTGGDLSGRR